MMELHVCSQSGQLLRAFALGEVERELIIGREEHCDVQIASRSVSREHCAIERDEEGLLLRDLGSTCGTIIDGRRVDHVRVQSGLEVHVGPAVLRFRDGDL
ncbi:MAG: FHA domain-containing protein [Planctomycetota bacterium]|jgi:S-DNA-T family DNA segregation ATPase FtsK/SpoIIIE